MASSNRTRSTPVQSRRERRRAERAAVRASGQPVRGRTTARNGRPSLGLIATAVAVVAGLVVIVAVALSQGAPGTGGSNTAGGALVAPGFTIPGDLGDTPAQLGDPNAPVKMEITEDFQCPICARFTTEQLPRLVDDFVRPGLLHITVHDVAFLDYTGTESIDAAAAAGCAGEQGRYWEYHDWLYANQHGEREGAFAPDRLRAIAQRIDLDMDAYDACVRAGAERANVTAATNDAVSKGIQATPTFVINGGQPIQGLPTYEQLSGYLRSLLPSGAASPSSTG